MQKMHHAYAVTGAICTGAAAKIPGSVVSDLFREGGNKVIIGHPKGVIDVNVDAVPFGESVNIKSVTVGRTARRLMSGVAYYTV
jgi:2-methylaconitate cis-trans-isomerase PrpF